MAEEGNEQTLSVFLVYALLLMPVKRATMNHREDKGQPARHDEGGYDSIEIHDTTVFISIIASNCKYCK